MTQKINIRKLILSNIVLLLLAVYLPGANVAPSVNTETIDINKNIEESIETVENIQVSSRSLQEPREEVEEIKNEIIEEDKSLDGYRVTSYYPGDNCSTGTKTGSGKSTTDFSTMTVNGKQVYSYQGRIVVAGATKELLKSGYDVKGSQENQVKHYFKYNDTGRIKIDGTWYGFIVLDSCGAAMWKGYYRLDIFVPSADNVIDLKNVEIVYD